MIEALSGGIGALLAVDPSPSPTALPDPLTDLDAEELLRHFGIDASRGEFWNVSGPELLAYIVVAAIAILVLRAMYRGMQRPRLALFYHDERPPTTSAAAIARYAVTPFLLVPLWYAAILGILVLAANRGDSLRPGEELLIAAGVVVGGSRLLAHVNLEGAHELAKSVPLTMISLILISGSVISFGAFFVTAYLLFLNLVAIGYFVLLLAVLDAAFTFGWLLWRRVEWHRQHRPPDEDRPPSWVVELWQALRSGWGSGQSGPSQPAARKVDPD
ncbi:MAG: hypothetical protein ACH36H_08225 [Candidatus Nanopelagicales bacterium]